jgi:hypothetical protein
MPRCVFYGRVASLVVPLFSSFFFLLHIFSLFNNYSSNSKNSSSAPPEITRLKGEAHGPHNRNEISMRSGSGHNGLCMDDNSFPSSARYFSRFESSTAFCWAEAQNCRRHHRSHWEHSYGSTQEGKLIYSHSF